MSTKATSRSLALIFGLAFAWGALAEERPAPAIPRGMIPIPAGIYRPFLRSENEPKEIRVASFWLNAYPVTNSDFLEFVRANPKWQRSRVKRLFADERYLEHWADDLDLGSGNVARRPVTRVSWFAAKAYAAWRGRRLPTIAEWEYAAAAGFSQADGSNDTEFTQALNHWYSSPSPQDLAVVGSGKPNFYGAYDLHGLIWEWTSDFNSSTVTGDARADTGLERRLFCGAGAQGSADRANFPAFMRFGFRSSLKAGYTVPNLGFRCAKDLEPVSQTNVPGDNAK